MNTDVPSIMQRVGYLGCPEQVENAQMLVDEYIKGTITLTVLLDTTLHGNYQLPLEIREAIVDYVWDVKWADKVFRD